MNSEICRSFNSSSVLYDARLATGYDCVRSSAFIEMVIGVGCICF